jgi:hypothetical protein
MAGFAKSDLLRMLALDSMDNWAVDCGTAAPPIFGLGKLHKKSRGLVPAFYAWVHDSQLWCGGFRYRSDRRVRRPKSGH